ncbi:hypothetical protein [Flavobacterium sp. 2]|uniref:hypothetical protein n=1 Tax=Flavobacterium sp. 2 TaxID=308053 RepID=UPI003CE883C6
MKVFVTLFLLTAIAFSLQFYLDNTQESYSEIIKTLTAPITTAILMLLIYFFSSQETKYRKTIGVIIIVCAILFLLFFVGFLYVAQLGKAFSH